MEDNIDWLFDDTPPCADSPGSNPNLRSEVKCEPCCEDQLHDGTLVKTERCVKEEGQVKEERKNIAVADMEEKVCWKFDGTLACEDLPGCNPPGGSEEKEEAGFEEQVPDGTGVQTVSVVKEELQVKEEREDKSGVMQSLSSPAGCGARDYQCGGAEGSIEFRGLQYVVLRRLSETGMVFALKEQNLEGMSMCEEQQAVDGGNSEGVGAGRESGKYKRGRQMKCNLQPGPGVSGQETAGLSPLETRQSRPPRQQQQQQQCRKKGPVPSPGSAVHEEAGDVCSPHVQTLPEGVRRLRQACPHCDYRCAMRDTLTRHVERCHGGLKRLSPSRSNASVRKRKKLKEGTEITPGCSRGHQCPRCQYTALSPDDLKAHIETDHKGLKKYKCSKCDFSTDFKRSLQRHMERKHELVHEDLKRYPCPQCQYTAGRKGHLQTHVETVHEDLRKHQCPHCEYRAGHKGALQRHVETVHEGSRKFKCPHCPYRAGQKGNLQTHVETVHEGLRKHQCPHCQYRAGQKGDLRKHIETVHEGLKRHKCPHCPYIVGQKGHLQTHIETVHEGIKRYQCPHCSYRAGQKGNLQKHVETVHEGLRKHKCPHCPYRAGQKDHLQTHVETVHEGLRKYQCPNCPYKAGQRSSLQTHVETVHQGLRRYECPHCPYKAGLKGNLQTHVTTVHEGLKPHKCPHCLYRAAQRGSLQTHVERVHEGLRRYKCPHCPYKAATKSHMQRHVHRKHAG